VPETNPHSVAAHYAGDFDDDALSSWARELRAQLVASEVTLGLVFMAPKFFPHALEVLEILRVHSRVPLLAGCSSQGLIAKGSEIEDDAGISLALYYLPGAELNPTRFTQGQVNECASPTFWHEEIGVNLDDVNSWLIFADPFHLDGETWLDQWNEAWPGRPILGGLASAGPNARSTQVYLNGEVFEDGGVAVAINGAIRLHSVVSQGCKPIGETWTITNAEDHFIREIANRPAYEVLVETFDGLSDEEQEKTKGNLFVGLVMNEYLEEFRQGDFLVRNLMGADPNVGAIAVGAFPRTGQTMQFQRRDARAAAEDLDALLDRVQTESGPIFGGVLCCCNGRGSHLFGTPGHDAGLVQQRLGPMGLAGFFCNGEIGPVGERNFLHGYTASLALFVGNTTNENLSSV